MPTFPAVHMEDAGDGGDDSGEDSGGDDDDEDKVRREDDDEEDDRLQPDSPVSRADHVLWYTFFLT